MQTPYTVKCVTLPDGSFIIKGRIFSNYAVISLLISLVIFPLVAYYLRSWLVTLVLLPWVVTQPFLTHFWIHLSNDSVKIRLTYIGITVVNITAPLPKLLLTGHILPTAKNRDCIIADFVGDFDSTAPYVTINYKGKEYFFSAEMLNGGDNYKFESELWLILNDCYYKIKHANSE